MKRSPRSTEGAIKSNRGGGSRWRIKQAWDARKARKRAERNKSIIPVRPLAIEIQCKTVALDDFVLLLVSYG